MVLMFPLVPTYLIISNFIINVLIQEYTYILYKTLILIYILIVLIYIYIYIGWHGNLAKQKQDQAGVQMAPVSPNGMVR